MKKKREMVWRLRRKITHLFISTPQERYYVPQNVCVTRCSGNGGSV